MKSIPVLYEYLRKYQEDPSSRIFAPLAEAYRKAGLIDEAINIAREGLQAHPTFIGGRVALARALFDKGNYDEAIKELTSVIREAPDNLMAQRLIAESSLMLGRTAEALGAYKVLLYFSPGDAETARIVLELETQAYDNGSLVLQTDLDSTHGFGVKPIGLALEEDPDTQRLNWVKRIEKLQGLLQCVERYRKEVV